MIICSLSFSHEHSMNFSATPCKLFMNEPKSIFSSKLTWTYDEVYKLQSAVEWERNKAKTIPYHQNIYRNPLDLLNIIVIIIRDWLNIRDWNSISWAFGWEVAGDGGVWGVREKDRLVWRIFCVLMFTEL